MATDINIKLESKEFLACIECRKVVMRMQTYIKKKKNTLMASFNHCLSVTLCYLCDKVNNIRNSSAWDNKGMVMHINRCMIEICVELVL